MSDFDSRNEQILEAIINETEYTDPPQSRNEAILKSILDEEEYTEEPQSRIEDLLLQLKEKIEQGGGGVSGTLIEYIAKNQIANYYINIDNGSAVYYEGWSATNFIEVTEGEVLHLALGSNQDEYKYNAWYNSNKRFLRNLNFGWSAGGYRTLTVPTGAKYLRISNTTDAMDHTQIWREKEI